MAYTESHRHFAGSITPETIWDIIKSTCRLDIASSLDDVRSQVCLIKKDIDFDYFCTRFNILNKLDWSGSIFYLVAKQVCNSIKSEGIDHCTLTVSLNKFTVGGHLVAAANRVFGILNETAEEIGLSLSYLLSISYNWPVALQAQMLKLADPLNNLVAGVDFVGDEFLAEWSIYPDLLEPWRCSGKEIRMHVGERLGTCANLQKAIELPVSRIAHGIYGAKEQWIQAIKQNIVFDVSLHSNIYTNAVGLKQHPIKQMLDTGCNVTLGTDDPVQFNCVLPEEYELAEALGADVVVLRQMADKWRIP